MWRRLREAIFGKPRPSRTAEFTHPELGRLVLNDDLDCWEATVECQGDSFAFAIGGREEPDPALLQHAVDILRDYASFKRRLREFLAEEAGRIGADEEEVAALTLDQVCLWWPERPDDGMIYYNGPDDLRLWRCDYVDRKPQGLGFDD